MLGRLSGSEGRMIPYINVPPFLPNGLKKEDILPTKVSNVGHADPSRAQMRNFRDCLFASFIGPDWKKVEKV